jgi:superfamily II DNA or RNA helicase
MTPMDYQIDLANLGYGILKENAIVYLAMEERTRKTLISILIAEMADIKTVLIITKKKPLTGWEETLAKFKHTKTYTLVNYHMANKVKGSFDLVILDEAHNYISGYPKRSKM